MLDRTRLVATLAGGISLVACNRPAQLSDLRPAGPPEVLAVLGNAPDTRAAYVGIPIETATFCKLNDDKRPEIVGTTDFSTIQVCPDDLSQGAPELTTAFPTQWYVRIMFDELLDTDVEDLVPELDANGNPTGATRGSIASTLPVVLQCAGADVPYDGYYSPSGNAESYPVGPSLVVQPADPTSIPSGTECTVQIQPNVLDKDGNPVPDGTQSGYGNEIGPYKFALDTLQLIDSEPEVVDLTTPAAELPIVEPESPIVLTFNVAIDPASVPASEIVLTEATSTCMPQGAPRTAVVTLDPDDPNSLDISDANTSDPTNLELVPKRFYLMSFVDGATAADLAGGTGSLPAAADFTLCFQTDVE